MKDDLKSQDAGAETDAELRDVHGAILREHHEPGEGREGVPLWFVTLIMLSVFWGGFYLAMNSGGFRADVFEPRKPRTTGAARADDPATLGQRTYVRNCVLCHQANGQGVPRQFPPLAASEWVLGTEGRGDNHLVAILLHGLEGPVQVRGETYRGAMPAWRFLRDEDIAAVLTYLRTSWGNAAKPVPPAFVAEVRAQTAARRKPWSQADLLAIPARWVDDATGSAVTGPSPEATQTR